MLFPTQIRGGIHKRNPLSGLRNEPHTVVTGARMEGKKDNSQQEAGGHQFESAMVLRQL